MSKLFVAEHEDKLMNESMVAIKEILECGQLELETIRMVMLMLTMVLLQ